MKLTEFVNDNFGTIRVMNKDGEPWFVAADVAQCLGVSNHRDMIRQLDEDNKGVGLIDTLGGPQEMATINEAGFYEAVLSSRKPEAKQFKKWVTSEVLPTIRKHGVYATNDFLDKFCEDPDFADNVLLRLKFEREQRRLAEEQRDYAVRTKSLIGSRREATSMATAAKAVKKAERLSEQIGDSKKYKSVKSIPWLNDVFSSINYSQIGKALVRISVELGCAVRRIEDSNWGSVNIYHVDVIEEFKSKLDDDPEFLAKYRYDN